MERAGAGVQKIDHYTIITLLSEDSFGRAYIVRNDQDG